MILRERASIALHFLATRLLWAFFSKGKRVRRQWDGCWKDKRKTKDVARRMEEVWLGGWEKGRWKAEAEGGLTRAVWKRCVSSQGISSVWAYWYNEYQSESKPSDLADLPWIRSPNWRFGKSQKDLCTARLANIHFYKGLSKTALCCRWRTERYLGLYLMSSGVLRSVFTTQELGSLADVMVERGPRLRQGLDEALESWDVIDFCELFLYFILSFFCQVQLSCCSIRNFLYSTTSSVLHLPRHHCSFTWAKCRLWRCFYNNSIQQRWWNWRCRHSDGPLPNCARSKRKVMEWRSWARSPATILAANADFLTPGDPLIQITLWPSTLWILFSISCRMVVRVPSIHGLCKESLFSPSARTKSSSSFCSVTTFTFASAKLCVKRITKQEVQITCYDLLQNPVFELRKRYINQDETGSLLPLPTTIYTNIRPRAFLSILRHKTSYYIITSYPPLCTTSWNNLRHETRRTRYNHTTSAIVPN